MDSESLYLLRRIGLNQYESRVYFSLLKAGPTSASEIGNVAEIPRPRTYDVLDKLEKKGFISVQPGRPTRFKAVDLDGAISFLKSRKEEDLKKSLRDIDDIKGKLSDKIRLTKPEDKVKAEDYVWVIKDRKNLHSKIEGLIHSAKDNILITANDNGIKNKLDAFEHPLRKACKRGVKIKVVSQLSNAGLAKRVCEFAELVKKEHNHRMMVIDDDVFLFLTPEPHEKEVGTWIKSPYIADNFRNLF